MQTPKQVRQTIQGLLRTLLTECLTKGSRERGESHRTRCLLNRQWRQNRELRRRVAKAQTDAEDDRTDDPNGFRGLRSDQCHETEAKDTESPAYEIPSANQIKAKADCLPTMPWGL